MKCALKNKAGIRGSITLCWRQAELLIINFILLLLLMQGRNTGFQSCFNITRTYILAKIQPTSGYNLLADQLSWLMWKVIHHKFWAHKNFEGYLFLSSCYYLENSFTVVVFLGPLRRLLGFIPYNFLIKCRCRALDKGCECVGGVWMKGVIWVHCLCPEFGSSAMPNWDQFVSKHFRPGWS